MGKDGVKMHTLICSVCGKKGRCLKSGVKCSDRKCTGTMHRPYKKIEQKSVMCVICKQWFIPLHKKQKSHTGECSRLLALKNAAILSRKRYAESKGHPVRKSNAKPWNWLRVADTEETPARRTILHTLEDQTDNGKWPYYDVLDGVMPSALDDVAWL